LVSGDGDGFWIAFREWRNYIPPENRRVYVLAPVKKKRAKKRRSK
jgi:hypothetical protein